MNLKGFGRRPKLARIFVASLFLYACDSGPVFTDLRVYSSTYSDVDWNSTLRLLSQHHDHIGVNTTRVAAYDSAGYDALSLMDYSGNTTLSYALQTRLWPPEKWLDSFTLANLASIRLFIPNSEEVGIDQHATSPFLTTYIEGATASAIGPANKQYTSVPELFTIVRENGGFPCLAHPLGFNFDSLRGSFCTEIYSAFTEARKFQGADGFSGGVDQKTTLIARWDSALQNNQQVFGIAVNDHFGPYETSVPDEIRDSGKIVVLAEQATLESYRNAFEQGRFFAIRDSGSTKGRFPRVERISIGSDDIRIETSSSVRWISNGRIIGRDPLFSRVDLPPNSTYLRAEVFDSGVDSIVFTQAFVIRPVGDIDGDYDIDADDDAICLGIENGDMASPIAKSACDAADSAKAR